MGLTDYYEEGKWMYLGSAKIFDDTKAVAWSGDGLFSYDKQDCAATDGNLIFDIYCDDDTYQYHGLCEIESNIC